MLDSIKLWKHFTSRRQRQFWLILILMVTVSLSEIISIGAVIPFLGILTVPEEIFQNPLIQPLIQFLELSEPTQLVLPLTILFIIVIILSGTLRLTLLYVITRLSYAAGADLSMDIYMRTLYQDYETHLSRNSSELINGTIYKTDTVISGILNPALMLISSTIILCGIVLVLFVINFAIALSISILFGMLYWLIIRYTKIQLKENSQTVADKSTEKVKVLQESLGGIRDVIIDNGQKFYSQLYLSADLPLRKALGNNIFISGSPRYLIEVIGMTLIVALAYYLTLQEGGINSGIPLLGALALGAQKLLPTLQQVYSSLSIIKGTKKSLEDVLDLLNQPMPDSENLISSESIPFNHEIKLNKLSFRYAKNTTWVLKDINLSFNKGSRIGFIGETGSGKSTLLDIIIGLLNPTKGELIIDQQSLNKENCRAWQVHIAHVPQNIYLSDSTIEENIAFGIPKEKINHQRVEKAAKQSQILELIEGWKDGYETFVGERGVRLSGGQRQRIGIARALYKEADVLIFDEATNALDNTTEYEVMKAIEGLGRDLTILIIAHRLTTLKGCDKIVRLGKNSVVDTGSYEEMIGLD
jgi:ATP-binding cassette, subfamily B, bacterial PglK